MEINLLSFVNELRISSSKRCSYLNFFLKRHSYNLGGMANSVLRKLLSGKLQKQNLTIFQKPELVEKTKKSKDTSVSKKQQHYNNWRSSTSFAAHLNDFLFNFDFLCFCFLGRVAEGATWSVRIILRRIFIRHSLDLHLQPERRRGRFWPHATHPRERRTHPHPHPV